MRDRPCPRPRSALEQGVIRLQHNVYFDGNVQSLTFTKGQDRATVGVIKPGRYTFGTSTEETMTVVSWILKARLPGSSEWKAYGEGESFVVPPNQSFDVECDADVVYTCIYR
jgi:uncharacterized protein YaiE (UPF0345 family)